MVDGFLSYWYPAAESDDFAAFRGSRFEAASKVKNAQLQKALKVALEAEKGVQDWVAFSMAAGAWVGWGKREC